MANDFVSDPGASAEVLSLDRIEEASVLSPVEEEDKTPQVKLSDTVSSQKKD